MKEDRVREAAVTEQDNVRGAAADEEIGTGGESGRRFRLTGCLGAKAAAFLLLLVSAAVCVAGAVGCYAVYDEQMYSRSYMSILKEGLSGQTQKIAYDLYNYLNNEYKESARLYLDEINAEVAVIRYDDKLASDSSIFLWQSYEPSEAMEENGFYSDLYNDFGLELPVFAEWVASESGTPKEMVYIIRVFYDPAFPIEDDIQAMVKLIEAVYRMRYAVIWLCAGGAIVFVICLIFLLCAAGHKNGREGIVPGILTRIPFDILTAGAGAAVIVLLNVIVELSYFGMDLLYFAGALAVGSVALVLSMVYLYDFAIRLKLGRFWRNTVIYAVVWFLWHGLRRLWRMLGRMIREFGRMIGEVPMTLAAIMAYGIICLGELLIIARFCRIIEGGAFLFFWGAVKLLIFAAVFYCVITFRKLLKASRELAEGHEDYRVDTGCMFWVFREQGENLNSLGQGVARAVSERMKSERLKTELITNVSHDLKTPLTSIINYAELISREAEGNPEENPNIREYSAVLLRQSGRLKRLLENLVEASKAATGNLEVDLEPCEAGVLLSQAMGEYQKRLEEKALELRVSQPEESVRILADGRHLWRVFDNLLNNICKYAQENSRVYLTLEQSEKKVFIIFRNMSKYALDISPEELEERFVRGDKSRHMEGNGLGLSIARSLTELQGGQMEVVVDGDLFKVILTFDAME